MFENLETMLKSWNKRTTERQKLQHSYIALLIAVIFIAGVVSLFNASRSRQLMYAAVALIITLITNFIIWGLLHTFVLEKLNPASGRRQQNR